MTRTRLWIVVAPVVAAGLLTAHALAYRLTSTPTDTFHAYLQHAPQVLLVLLLCGAALGGFGTRRNAPPAYAFPLVALAAFVVQEHLERIVHGGALPILVTSPAFLLGLALQVPVALLAWVLARWLLDVVQEAGSQRTLRPRFELGLGALPRARVGRTESPILHGRGPPTPLLSR